MVAPRLFRFEEINTAYRNMLIAVRTSSGMSAAQFADMVGWDRKEYADLERGQGWGCSLKGLLEVAWNTNLAPEVLVSAMLTFLASGTNPRSYSLDQCQLFRLAWVDAFGIIRDADTASYQSVNTACEDLPSRNILRKAQGLPLLNRISAYACLGHLMVSMQDYDETGAVALGIPQDSCASRTGTA